MSDESGRFSGEPEDGDAGAGRNQVFAGPIEKSIFVQGNMYGESWGESGGKTEEGEVSQAWSIPLPDQRFTGRQVEIVQLGIALEVTGRACLFGMGGVGKTQLAYAYADAGHKSGKYQVGAVIRAEEPETLLSDMQYLGQALGVSISAEIDTEIQIRLLQDALAKTDGWLLILDNVKKPSLARKLLPLHRGHVIITSRWTRGWEEIASPFDLRVFTRDVSVEYLTKVTHDTDEDAANRIAEALGDLPLALAQAAAQIQILSIGLGGYLDRLTREAADLFRSDLEGVLVSYDKVVATTWKLAVAELRTDHPGAAKIAELCAFLASEEIPDEVLLVGNFEENKGAKSEDTKEPGRQKISADGPVHEEEASKSTHKKDAQDRLEDDLACLGSRSLLRRDGVTGTSSMHPLLQRAIREDPDTPEEARVGVLLEHLNNLFPVDAAESHARMTCKRIAPHVLALVARTEKFPGFRLATRAELADKTAFYFHAMGRYEEAFPLFDKALACRYQDCFSLRHCRAWTLNGRGYYQEAFAEFQQILAEQNEAFGAEHPATLQTSHGLAWTLNAMGRHEEAASLFGRVLLSREKVLGQNDPSTFRSQQGLAMAYDNLGRRVEAREMFAQVLAGRERVLGPEHPDTLASRQNLALVHNDLGRYQTASEMFAQVLTGRERALGPDHPSCLASLHGLAVTLRNLGELDEAFTLFHKVLAGREEAFGPDHPGVLSARHGLAWTLGKLGRHEEAKTSLQFLLVDADRVLGPDHPDTLWIRHGLAVTLRNLGELDEAFTLFHKVLAGREEAFGPDHPGVLSSRHGLAWTLGELGDHLQACEMFAQVCEDRERILGREHPDTLRSRYGLAWMFGELGDYFQAREMFAQVFEDRGRVLGPDHPDTKETEESLLWARDRTRRRLPWPRRRKHKNTDSSGNLLEADNREDPDDDSDNPPV